MIPGELFPAGGDIVALEGRETVTLEVRNAGDRPVQVGSHFHFFEVNRALAFDRAAAFGMRLSIPAGTAVRFEPGETKPVTLVALGGAREVRGLNGLTEGPATPERRAAALERARAFLIGTAGPLVRAGAAGASPAGAGRREPSDAPAPSRGQDAGKGQP